MPTTSTKDQKKGKSKVSKSPRGLVRQKPNGVGAPTTYSDAIVEEICGRLSMGQSLNRICKDKGMPDIRTVFNWLGRHEEFVHKYARAKQESADALFESILDDAEEVRSGRLDPNAGRVIIDAKKWAASKMKPKVYGDKIDLTSGGEKLPTPVYAGKAARTLIEGEVVQQG